MAFEGHRTGKKRKHGRINRKLVLILSVLSMSLIGSIPTAIAMPGYSIIDLGTVRPTDINDAGQVVGVSAGSAFLYENNVMTTLGSPEIGYSEATAINNLGQIVGEAEFVQSGQRHAFLYDSGNWSDLGVTDTMNFSESRAFDINDSGQIVGRVGGGGPTGQAFLYDNGEMVDLRTMVENTDIAWGWATGINNNGDIVGSFKTDNSTGLRNQAHIYKDGTLTDMAVGYYSNESVPNDLNDNGQVVGLNSFNIQGWLWEDGGQMQDLNSQYPAIDSASIATGINNQGQIVGHNYLSSDLSTFLISNNNLYDIERLIDNPSSLVLDSLYPTAINDSGQIVGTGLIDGENRGFLLNPEWDAYVTTDIAYQYDVTLGDNFTFDYWWDMGIDPTELNLDILLFNGAEWEVFGWDLNLEGSSTEWMTAAFYVPEWARGMQAKVIFQVFDLGQQTNPSVFLKDISGSASSAPVPEPSSLILLSSAIVGIAGAIRKKCK